MNLFYYVFYRCYDSNLGELYKDEKAASILVATLFSVNVVTAAIYLFPLLNYDPMSVLFSVYTLIFYLAVCGFSLFWFLYKSRYKKILDHYYYIENETPMAVYMWIHLILSAALFTMAVSYAKGYELVM